MGGAGLESMPSRVPRAGAAVVESSPVQRAVAEERRQVVADGIEGMKKIELGRADDIRPQEQAGLEAIILLTGRPALLIQDGTFMDPPPLWADLKTARDPINSVIARVGRIEVSGNPNFDWLGTGFLVGADVVVTNRHVAMEFSRTAIGRHVDVPIADGILRGLQGGVRVWRLTGLRRERDHRHP